MRKKTKPVAQPKITQIYDWTGITFDVSTFRRIAAEMAGLPGDAQVYASGGKIGWHGEECYLVKVTENK